MISPLNISKGLERLGWGCSPLASLVFIGLQEIKLRYRRSILGPFWITLSMAAMIIGMGISCIRDIFKQDINTYLPFFASGYIVWFYVNALVQEGCVVFIQDGTYVRQCPDPC